MYIFTQVKNIGVTLYGEMCVSDGKASMPITCRTSSNCPPSAWLKCFLACLTNKKRHTINELLTKCYLAKRVAKILNTFR